jgi:hypothetical protein
MLTLSVRDLDEGRGFVKLIVAWYANDDAGQEHPIRLCDAIEVFGSREVVFALEHMLIEVFGPGYIDSDGAGLTWVKRKGCTQRSLERAHKHAARLQLLEAS